MSQNPSSWIGRCFRSTSCDGLAHVPGCTTAVRKAVVMELAAQLEQLLVPLGRVESHILLVTQLAFSWMNFGVCLAGRLDSEIRKYPYMRLDSLHQIYVSRGNQRQIHCGPSASTACRSLISDSWDSSLAGFPFWLTAFRRAMSRQMNSIREILDNERFPGTASGDS
jgi:hypothetical protein